MTWRELVRIAVWSFAAGFLGAAVRDLVRWLGRDDER